MSGARKPIVLAPGAGRAYDMGAIGATFKADGEETARGYSISEWRLQPHTQGPGAHSHPEDCVFYVVQGTMHVRVEDTWHAGTPGTFVLVPGGTTHDFENRGEVAAAVLNFTAPGTFEEHMPGIVAWFRDNPPGNC